MYLIEDNQALFVLREIEFRVGEPCPVCWEFQVKIECLIATLVRQGTGERGLANLSGSELCHCGELSQELAQLR